ncbi:MAG: aminoacyl-tRNA hydrolase [Myxococcota bacterium]
MATMRMVVGLGNPGSEYEDTRHNAGFMVVDALARRLNAPSWQRKFKGEIAEVRDNSLGDDGRVLFVKPQTYMNLSGECVRAAADFYKVAPAQILVAHDELDLPLGKLRVKVGGGHGGHNGLRSLHQHLGPEYARIRLGIGKPAGAKGDHVVNHVLGGFKKHEREEMDLMLAEAQDAVLMWLKQGPQATMNRFNTDAPAKKPVK